jgi:type II secretory pathway predicted ATPase ExeA
MYLEFFGLRAAPFRITPDTDFWFPGAQRGEILDALVYALSHGEGLIKVVGEVGSGKTMLLRMLLNRLPETVDSVYLANPTLSPDEILAALLTDLGADPAPGTSRQVMLEQLNRLLLDKHRHGRRVVVLVEEAQGMALESLEFLRLLTNLETARDKLLQIVLFGQPELDELLANPRIRQFKDRITLNLRLDPLPAETVPAYLQARLAAAGYRGPDLFNARTIQAITRFSGGLGRRINILADKTLLAAYGDQTHNLSRAHVEAAANDAELTKSTGRRKLGWVWVAAGVAAGLGLMSYLAWLGLGQPPALVQTPARVVSPARSAPALPAPVPAALPPAEALATETLAWLDQAASGTFVIQLYTAKDALDASAFVKGLATLAMPKPLRVFPAPTASGVRWMVVAGEFNQLALAEAAVASLPVALQATEPFVRSVGKIRRSLGGPTQKDPS